MAFIMRLIDKWAAMENDAMDRLVDKYYGPIFRIGLVFPSWKRSALPFTIPWMILNVSVFLWNIALLGITIYKAFLCDNDIDLFSLVTHYFLIIFNTFLSIMILNWDREINSLNHTRIASDVGEYKDGRIYSYKACILMEKEIRKETMRYMCLPLLIILAGGVILILPYGSKLIRGYGMMYTTCGVDLFLPFPLYHPFPTHEGINHYLALLSQVLIVCFLANIIIAGMLNFVQYSQRVKLEYKVLGYSLDTLFARSQKVYFKSYPDKKANFNIRDLDFQQIIGSLLRDSIVHHQSLIDIMDNYHGLITYPIVLAYITGAGAIGLGLTSISRALQKGDIETLLLFLIMMLGEVITILTISLIGESVTEETHALRYKLYNVRWYDMDIPNRRSLLNFQTFITEPLVLTAGKGLVNLTLETFSTILNSAYSFFNLVNVQQS
uniref:Odorant receptor n=1 Tax=Apolygus lucorum TaxID=248454 RepID=A0A4P8PCB8_APOLU|nr:olfactory receptor protein 82 [Apolygus lucorum]